tara:strand:- start:156475 stop:157314 length:840 start_codon:yes stop_codon:yes gene_type:complete
MTRVFITGASGLLGGALLRQFVQTDTEIWVLENNKPFLELNSVNVKAVGRAQLSNLPEFDVIFHLAARVGFGREIEKDIFESNVLLTKELCALPCKRFVYASSVSVYDSTPEIIFENSAICPTNPYAQSKYWGEYYVRQLSSYAILRFSSLFGEGMSLSTFLPRMILQAIENKKIILYGDGSRRQNYLHVDEAVQYLITASQTSLNIIGLGVESVSINNREAADIIEELCEVSIQYEGIDEDPSFEYNNEFTKQSIGFVSGSRNFKKDLLALYQWIKGL